MQNLQIKGYLNFDISELGRVNVLDASLIIPASLIRGNPVNISNLLIIKAYYYGDVLDLDDFRVGGTYITTIDITGIREGDYLQIYDNNSLKNTLQEAIDDDSRDRYQLKLGLNAKTNNNGSIDYIDIYQGQVDLNIIYTE